MCGETRGNDLQPGHLSLVVDLGGVVLRLDKHGTKYIFSKENLCIIITMSLFSVMPGLGEREYRTAL